MKFDKMVELEKIEYLNGKLNDTKTFLKQAEASGWSYDSAIRLRIEELEWIMSKLNK